MQTPLQLTFRNVPHSDALAAHIGQHVDQLEHLCDRVVSCHVVIDLIGHDQHRAPRYHFSINLNVPGHEVVVTHAPTDHSDENAYATADRAFDETRRQLKDWIARQREHRHDHA